MRAVTLPEVLPVQFPREAYVRSDLPRPVYAFDIDGVLADTRPVHGPALEAELGVTLTDGGDWNSFGFAHPDPAVMVRLREIALDRWRGVAHQAHPSGADVLWQLHLEGRLRGYVTRREKAMHLLTLDWRKQHGFPFGPGLRLTSLGHGGGCKSLVHADAILVEDSPHEAWSAAQNGVRVRVVRRPYNADFEDRWQQNRADPAGPDAQTWCRIDFISDLQELL